jgi:hypothetical protein
MDWDRHGVNATDTVRVLDSHAHVTFLTPGGSPGISKDPVFSSRFWTPTDKCDSVVVNVAAVLVIINSTGVSVERRGISLDWDLDGALCQSSLHLVRTVGSDGMIAAHNNIGVGLIVILAGSVAGSVGVITFENGEVGLPPGEGLSWVTSVAAITTVHAVHKFLFGKWPQVSSLDLVSTLESAGSSKSPAGAAGSLVLNMVNSTKSAPVDSGRVDGVVNFVKSFSGNRAVTVEAIALLAGPVGVLVVANRVGLTGVAQDEGFSLEEVSETVFVFFDGCVGFAELSEILAEFVGVNGVGGGGNGEESERGERFHN